MISVEEAQRTILAAIKPVGAEVLELADASRRYLAKDITALRTQPTGPLSAMDGYAVRHEDVATTPVTLDVVGTVPAGQAFDGTLQPGQAVRIFTGAAMPDGGDTVVIQENTKCGGSSPVPGPVTILEAPIAGKNVRPEGLDFTTGDVVAKAGEKLTAPRIGLIGTAAANTVSVARRPRVAILATGDELVPPGVEPGPNQIVAANTVMLSALFEDAGAEVIDLGIAPDEADALKEMAAAGLKGSASADLFITIGGASVGEYDLVQSALGEIGLELNFWKIAMRPGKPLIFGALDKTPMIGLPGNPVSAFVCAVMFVLPAIRALQGASTPLPRTIMMKLAEEMPANSARQAYIRGSMIVEGDGSQAVRPHGVQDSSALLSLSQSDVLIARAPDAAPAAKGNAVPVILL